MDDPFAAPESDVAPVRAPLAPAPSFGSVMGRGGGLLWRHPLGALVFVLLNLPTQMLDSGLFVIAALASVAIDPFSTAYWVGRARGEKRFEARRVLRRWLPAFFFGVLSMVATFIGLVLLVFPAVIIGMRWWFVTAFVVLEDCGWDAFSRSRELGRGRSRTTMWLMIVSLAMSFATGALGEFLGGTTAVTWGLHVIQTVIQVWIAAAGVVLFVDLRAEEGPVAPSPGLRAFG